MLIKEFKGALAILQESETRARCSQDPQDIGDRKWFNITENFIYFMLLGFCFAFDMFANPQAGLSIKHSELYQKDPSFLIKRGCIFHCWACYSFLLCYTVVEKYVEWLEILTLM